MRSFLERYSRCLVSHAWLVLVATLAASALVASGVGRLAVDLDMEK